MILYTTHPFFNEGANKRLLEEYLKYGSLYVAFDFDNTIYDFHNDGGDYSAVIDILKESSNYGFKMILFSAETNPEKLKWKIEYSKQLGINVDYINESPVIPGSAKPYYNILLDDRAGLESAYNSLKFVIDYIKTNK